MSRPTSQLKTMVTLALALLLGSILVARAHAQEDKARAPASRLPESIPISALEELLKERGFGAEEIEAIIYAAQSRLLRPAEDFPAFKRAGWKRRIPIQTRFASFGTKLVPSRSRGEANGPTLLRYGRSA